MLSVLGSNDWRQGAADYRIRLYVNGIFQTFRSHFGPKRRTGARRLRRLPFVELRTMRDLKKNVLS